MDAELPGIATLLAAVDSPLHYLLFIGGVSMITVALLYRYRKRYRQQARNRITPQEQIERTSQHRGLRGDIERLMVEVEQLTKRFATQLDAKSIELEHLLREADDRIAQLKQSADSYRVRDTRTDFTGAAGSDVAASLRTNPGATSVESDPIDDPTNALTGRVYAMADTGLGAADIARQLDEHIGKVELILALREAS